MSGPTTTIRVAWEGAFLAAFAAALTVAAWLIYPAWDDGWLWLQARRGSAGLEASMADRPLVGWLWARLAHAGLLLPLSAVLHWSGWLGLGGVTAGLWRRWFPRRPELAVVAALLAMGTVSIQVQHVLIVGVWGVAAPTVLVGLALLVLLPPAPRRPAGAARLAAAALLVVIGTLLSEYGLVAALVVTALLLFRSGGRGAAGRRGALVVLAAALASYLVLLAFADHAVRPATGPARLLEAAGGRLLALPFLVLGELWQGALGNLLVRLGRLEVHSLESLLVALVSALAAAGVLRLVRPRAAEEAAADVRGDSRGALALLTASALALLALLAVGRVPWQGVTSRYLLPVAAPLSCLTLWIVLRLVRREWSRGAAVAVAFVVTFATLQDSTAHVVERRRVERLAPALLPHLDPDGFNLVVLVPREDTALARRAAGYELTARLARRLPADLRERLWAVRFDQMRDEGVTGVGPLAAPGERPAIDLAVRGLARHQPVQRVVWVEIDRRGGRVTAIGGGAGRGPPARRASGGS